MNFKELQPAIEAWKGDNENLAIVVMAIEKTGSDGKSTHYSTGGCVMGQGAMIISAIKHELKDTAKDNTLGMLLRRAVHEVQLENALDDLEEYAGRLEKSLKELASMKDNKKSRRFNKKGGNHE